MKTIERKADESIEAPTTYAPFTARKGSKKLFEELEARVAFGDILEHFTDTFPAEGYARPGIEYVLETLACMARKKSERFLHHHKDDILATKWDHVARVLNEAIEEINPEYQRQLSKPVQAHFNHVFEIAFEVDSERDSPDIPVGEIRKALEARLKRLGAVGDDELLEAVGDPVETLDTTTY